MASPLRSSSGWMAPATATSAPAADAPAATTPTRTGRSTPERIIGGTWASTQDRPPELTYSPSSNTDAWFEPIHAPTEFTPSHPRSVGRSSKRVVPPARTGVSSAEGEGGSSSRHR
jgi:hypothetical protein